MSYYYNREGFEEMTETAKKVLLYLTIVATVIVILAYGANYIYGIGKKAVEAENIEKVVSDNAKYVSYVEKLLREELKSLDVKIQKQGDTIHRMDKQLVAISTHLKVAIIEEEDE